MTSEKLIDVVRETAVFLRLRGCISKQMTDEQYIRNTLGDYVVEQHCLWMCEDILARGVGGVGTKSHRWLGYIQGELRGLGLYSVMELRSMSRA